MATIRHYFLSCFPLPSTGALCTHETDFATQVAVPKWRNFHSKMWCPQQKQTQSLAATRRPIGRPQNNPLNNLGGIESMAKVPLLDGQRANRTNWNGPRDSDSEHDSEHEKWALVTRKSKFKKSHGKARLPSDSHPGWTVTNTQVRPRTPHTASATAESSTTTTMAKPLRTTTDQRVSLLPKFSTCNQLPPSTGHTGYPISLICHSLVTPTTPILHHLSSNSQFTFP